MACLERGLSALPLALSRLRSKLINLAQPETVDERALNIPPEGKALNPWEMTENQNIVINSARSIGCQVVNIHASDLIKAAEEHKEHLVLGLVWQIVKVQLLSQISIKEVPQLVTLLQEGEDLATLMKLPPEEVLLRWIRHHLAKDGCDRPVNNLHSDLKDGEVYLRVLHSIAPESCPAAEALANPDPLARAEKVRQLPRACGPRAVHMGAASLELQRLRRASVALHASPLAWLSPRCLHLTAPPAPLTSAPLSPQVIENARAVDVPAFIQPGDITSGNRRLNLAFVAQIFNTNHGLDAKEEDIKKVEEAFEAAGLDDEDSDEAEAAREARVFRVWLNALNIGDKQITNLYDDLNDGIILIDAVNKISPGLVDEKRVNRDRAKLNRFKKIENCNYAVQLGRELGFSMPGTGGIDIAGGNKKLVLGFVWQLMRLQTVKMLQEVGGGTIPKDADIIAWANAAVAEAGREGSISSFKDSSLGSGCVRPLRMTARGRGSGRAHGLISTHRRHASGAPVPQLPLTPAFPLFCSPLPPRSVYLLNLLGAIESRAINPAIPTAGETDEERAKNCKYAIAVARKIGAQVFCTWEDIRDVKPKMLMTFIGSIMHTAKARHAAKAGAGAGSA